VGAARIVDGTVGALYSTENALQEAIVEWARYRRVPAIGRLRDEPSSFSSSDGFGLSQLKEESTTYFVEGGFRTRLGIDALDNHFTKDFWTVYDFMFAVPNGMMLAGTAGRRARYMNAMKNRGLKPGVSDLVIAYPVAPYHGMMLELKLKENSKIIDTQTSWANLMNAVGYYATIAAGFNNAIWAIENYLKGSYSEA